MREWLEAQNWQVVDVKAPNRKNNPWTFRGKSSRAFSYQLDGYDDQYILIRRWEKKRPADDDAKPLAGSQWWSKMSYYEDEEKEDPIEDMVFLPFGGPLKLSRRSRTLQRMLLWKVTPMAPRRPKLIRKVAKHEKKKEKDDPNKIVEGMPGPSISGKKTTVLDTGGRGDCGWRALAFVCRIHQSKWAWN